MSTIPELLPGVRTLPSGARPCLFIADDMPAIVAATGLPIAHGVSAEAVARMLDAAFRLAAAQRLLPVAVAGTSGRKSWLRALETDLVQIYHFSFGYSAASGEACDDAPCRAPPRWLRCLCRIAIARASGWCPHHGFSEILKLSDNTIATYLRRAVTRLRRQVPEKEQASADVISGFFPPPWSASFCTIGHGTAAWRANRS